MQIKLPQQDQEEQLNSQKQPNHISSQPKEQVDQSKEKFKYIIYAVIIIVLIIVFFMSSQKTVKVNYNDYDLASPKRKYSKLTPSVQKQEKVEKQQTIKISNEHQKEENEEFVVQKFGQQEQLKAVDWDQIKPQNNDKPKRSSVNQQKNKQNLVQKVDKYIQNNPNKQNKPKQQPVNFEKDKKAQFNKKNIKPQDSMNQKEKNPNNQAQQTTNDQKINKKQVKTVDEKKKNTQTQQKPQAVQKQLPKIQEKKITIDEIKAQVLKKQKQSKLIQKQQKEVSKDKVNEQIPQKQHQPKVIQTKANNIPVKKPKDEELKVFLPQQKPFSQTAATSNTQAFKKPKQLVQTHQKHQNNPKQQQQRKIIQQLKKNPQQLKDPIHESQKNTPLKKDLTVAQKQTQIQKFKKTLSGGMVNPFRSPKFNIPKYLWTFSQPIEQLSYSFYVRKCIENLKYFAEKSQFQFTIISSANYMNYLSLQSVKKIQFTLSTLKTRQLREPNSNLKDHFQAIKRRLICFHILNEKGGIFVEKNVLLTETFNWINDISQNIYSNKGNGKATPKYIAFFDIDHGSSYEKHNKSNIIYDTERYMIQFPSIQPYFFAAVPKGAFLTQTLIEYVQLLQKPETLNQKLKKYQLKMGALKGKDLYYQVLYISQHLVLQRKQKEINSSGNNKYDNSFAIDYYGLFTINQRYFPKKMQFTFQNNHQQKVYWNLARYSLHELQQTTGPLRYFVCMIFQNHINYRLQKARNHQSRYYIHPQSFLGKYLINDKSQPYILTEIQKSVVNKEGKKWQKLPKIIWLYWDTGIENSTLGNKLCVQNIKRFANYAQFQVREINNSNTEKHIGKYLNEKIENYIKNKKITTYAQTKSDFVRIALMARHGGIYMDASYFSVEFLNWIIQISKYPSEFIFNRYGELPRVLMHFHPHFGQPFQWTYDKEANTKHMWLSAYENNILISEPNQQLFWDWLDEYGRFVTSAYEQTEQLMKKYGVFGDRWTSKDNVYLAAMDSIKNVIGKKELQIKQKRKDANYKGPKSAAQFYGIWSISGYRGQQKFRAHTNFDNTNFNKPHNSDNPFLWRYSQNYVSGIIGSVKHLVKLYGWNIKYLNAVLYSDVDNRFQSQVHPISYFSKYLLFSYRNNIKKEGDKLILDVKKK